MGEILETSLGTYGRAGAPTDKENESSQDIIHELWIEGGVCGVSDAKFIFVNGVN